MARLTSLPPRLVAIRPKLAAPKCEAKRTAYRRKINPWRGWYNLARWCAEPHGLRWQTLVRDMFICQMCGRGEADTSKLVADHIKPHRGDPKLFWDIDNLQCLCRSCHDSDKAKLEWQQGFR